MHLPCTVSQAHLILLSFPLAAALHLIQVGPARPPLAATLGSRGGCLALSVESRESPFSSPLGPAVSHRWVSSWLMGDRASMGFTCKVPKSCVGLSFVCFYAESQGPPWSTAGYAVWVLVSNVFSWFGFCGDWAPHNLSPCVTHFGEHVLLYLTSKVPELRTPVVRLERSHPIFQKGTRLPRLCANPRGKRDTWVPFHSRVILLTLSLEKRQKG